MRTRTTAVLIGFLFFACDVQDQPTTTAPPIGEPVFDDDWTPTKPGELGPAVLTPSEEGDGKWARRMSVDQLRRSVPAMFGGQTWTLQLGRANGIAFDILSRTLGEADYIEVNADNTEPSPLFAKYMDDMAGDVCGKAIAADRAAGPNDDKVLMVEEDVEQNLRFLRLKLHGIYVAEGTTDGIEDLSALYDAILAASNDAESAWFGVCVAMLTAPELMAY